MWLKTKTTNSDLRSEPFWRDLCAVLVVFAGVLALWSGLTIWGMSLAASVFSPRDKFRERLVVLPSGIVLVERRNANGPAQPVYRTLDNNPVDLTQIDKTVDLAYLPRRPDTKPTQLLPWKDRILSVCEIKSGVYWYLLHYGGQDDGHAQLIGFDPLTSRNVGYCGSDEFGTSPFSTSQQFRFDERLAGHKKGATVGFTESNGRLPLYRRQATPPLGHVFVVDAGRVLDINLADRIVTPLSIDEPVISIAQGSYPEKSSGEVEISAPLGVARKIGDSLTTTRLFLRTDSKVIVMDPVSNERFESEIPKQLVDHSLRIGVQSGENVIYITEPSESSDETTVFWTNAADGSSVHQSATLHQPENRMVATLMKGWGAAFALPVPLFQAARGAYSQVASSAAIGEAPSSTWSLAGTASYWPAAVGLGAASLVCAMYLFVVRNSRYQEHALRWALATLIFGPLILVAYMIDVKSPPLETCSSCEHVVPSNCEICACCGRRLSGSPRIGTEIVFPWRLVSSASLGSQ